MPFTYVGGGVAGVFENLGDGDLSLPQVRLLRLIVDPVIDTRSDMLATGHQSGSRRRTNGAAGVKGLKASSTGRERVDGGRLDGTAVGADIAGAQIVGQENNDIRSLGILGKQS